MSGATDPLLSFRGEFPILSSTTYLISNSFGAMPRAAEGALAEYAQTWATRGVRAWSEGWWELSVSVGDEIAPLIGASAGSAYQSAGTLPVSVDALGVDALLGGVLKWLCGGPGGAFLYVRPEARPRLVPALTGWMAHPAPFDFDPPPMRYRDDAFRFLLGTPAIPALYAAREGPRLVRRAGMERIREESLRQTGRLLELADARDFLSATPREPERRGGTVAVDFEGALEVSRELNARDILVDYRPGVGIRLSPHFYTDDAELDRAFGVIDEIRAGGAGRRWKSRPSLVT